jgi:uncharacterized protein with PIN domain
MNIVIDTSALIAVIADKPERSKLIEGFMVGFTALHRPD